MAVHMNDDQGRPLCGGMGKSYELTFTKEAVSCRKCLKAVQAREVESEAINTFARVAVAPLDAAAVAARRERLPYVNAAVYVEQLETAAVLVGVYVGHNTPSALKAARVILRDIQSHLADTLRAVDKEIHRIETPPTPAQESEGK